MGRLANATEYEFDEGVCERGTDYYRSGAVRIVEGGPLAVLARVRGSREYTVKLGLHEGALLADCDCPYFSVDFCKHIWAAILAADNAGHLRLPATAEAVPLRRSQKVDPNATRVATPNAHGLGKTAGPAALDRNHDHDFDDDDEACPIGDDIEVDDEADDLSEEDDLSSYGTPAPKAKGITSPPVLTDAVYAPKKPWQQQLDRLAFQGHHWMFLARARLQERYGLWYVLNASDNGAYDRMSVSIEVMQRQRNGEWVPCRRRFMEDEIPSFLADPQDRRLYALLTVKHSPSYDWQTRYQSKLQGEALKVLLPELCQTGRFFWRSYGGNNMTLLNWDDGPPWAFRLEVFHDIKARQYILRGILQREGVRRNLSDALILNADGWVVFPESVARFDDAHSRYWVMLLRQEREIRVPLSDGPKVVECLCALPYLPPVDWPDDLRVEEVAPAPKPALRISVSERTRAAKVYGQLLFGYDGEWVPALPMLRVIPRANKRHMIRRDPVAEEQALDVLTALGFRQPPNAPHPELHAKHVPEVVRTLLTRGWRVEAEGKLYRQPGPFKIDVSSGIDWFELHGTCDFDGQSVALPALLEALRKGDGMIQLGDGSFGILPETWLNRCGLLAATGKVHGDGLRYRKSQAGLLDALLAAEPQATCDEAFTRIRAELRAFERIEPADPPASFDGQLRPYQRDGLGWFRFLEQFGFGGCLADDMGLGKTVEVLALLEARRARRETSGNGNGQPHTTLAVVPRSLIFNWKQEAARFAPRLRVLDHTGAERVRTGYDHFEEYDLVLTTYGTLLRDIVHLSAFEFDYVILDEAQAIKNADTASSKAARLLRGRHRLCLSGTPIENRLSELWSLFEFLNPGMLGAATVFQSIADGGLEARGPGSAAVSAAQSPNTISPGGRDARGPQTAAVPVAPDGRALLARALRPFILRRTKAQVAADLPEKTEQTIYCELDVRQRAQYDEIRRYYRALLLEKTDAEEWSKSKLKILEGLLRLRQAACHPGLIDAARKGESSAKLEALLPQIEEVVGEGHKVLVFSQFTQFLAIVRKRLDAAKMTYEYLDGKTRDRQACVKRFQEDESCKLFLISLKAGGLGLNLTAAEYVFLLDPWWNPAVEAQAIDRAHRIGQTRQVFAYRLIARDTVEEKVLELQRGKRALADAIVNADNSLIRDISPADLELLLG